MIDIETKQINFQAIGSSWRIKVFDQSPDLNLLETETEKLVKTFENNYSRFIPDSYVSILNREKVISDFPSEMFEMIKLSEEVRKVTNGHFDICVGRNLESLGYDSNYSFTSTVSSSIANEINYSIEKIQVAKDTSIDLGGIGKGWLIDKISNLLKELGIQYFIVNGGGDIFATSNEGNKLKFALENPFDTSEMIGTIEIIDSSIACSAPNRRKWLDKKTGESLHHLVDNITGKPVQSLSAVFTAGKNATNTDLCSTAIFVSPEELWEDISKKLEVEYLAVFNDGKFLRSSNYKGILN